jgi:hypothetical protein
MVHCQHMKKDILIGSAVLIVVIIGIIGYAALRPRSAEAPVAADASGLPAGAYEEHAAYYDIAANYATSTPLLALVSSSADSAAVGLMKQFVADTIAQFKKDGNFANLTAEDISMMGFDQGRKETLNIVYLVASSLHTASYIFTTYEDTLGAHGNTFFHTFTFDTKTGKALSLSDIFLPGSDYLATLSTKSRALLPGVIGDGADTGMISSGTTPDEKNFSNFFFDNADFVVLFDPYQVAPYAAGPQTLRIPVTALADILKPEYRQ